MLDWVDNGHNNYFTGQITTYNVVRVLEIIRNSTSVTVKLYDETNTLLYTASHTLESTYNPEDCYYFFARNMKNTNQTTDVYAILAQKMEG